MPEGRLYIFKRLRRHTDFLRLYYDPTKKFKLKNYNEKKSNKMMKKNNSIDASQTDVRFITEKN